MQIYKSELTEGKENNQKIIKFPLNTIKESKRNL